MFAQGKHGAQWELMKETSSLGLVAMQISGGEVVPPMNMVTDPEGFERGERHVYTSEVSKCWFRHWWIF